MPEISPFYGIVVRMFCRDHLPPHFHAYCAFRPLLPPIPLSKLPPSPAIAATPSERSDAGLGWSVGLGVFGLLGSLQFPHGIACQCQPVGMVHKAI